MFSGGFKGSHAVIGLANLTGYLIVLPYGIFPKLANVCVNGELKSSSEFYGYYFTII